MSNAVEQAMREELLRQSETEVLGDLFCDFAEGTEGARLGNADIVDGAVDLPALAAVAAKAAREEMPDAVAALTHSELEGALIVPDGDDWVVRWSSLGPDDHLRLVLFLQSAS